MPYADPAAKKANDRRYRETHKADRSEYFKQYAREHRADAVRRSTLWRERHPGKAQAYRKEYRARPEVKARLRLLQRLRAYNLTLEQYQALSEAQQGRCAACGEQAELMVDHDHETGQVRGLLCNGCNAALGFLRDDLQRAQGLVDYLSREVDHAV